MKDYADKIALRVLEEFTGREGTPVEETNLPDTLARAIRTGYKLGYSAGYSAGYSDGLTDEPR